MGDIVACTPFATWLRQQYPQSLIVWVAQLPYHEVLRGNSNIDAVLSPYCMTGWIWLKKFQVYDQLIHPTSCEKCQHGLIKEGKAGDVNGQNYYDLGSILSAHSRTAGCSFDEGDPEVPISREISSRVDRLELRPLRLYPHHLRRRSEGLAAHALESPHRSHHRRARIVHR